MTDSAIIDLYLRRDSRALSETDARYGAYCLTIAANILRCREDAEESVNDTYLAAWNTIPPTRPDSLKAYLGRICRRLSISALRAKTAQKRGGGEVALALEELAECVRSECDVAREVELRELGAAVSAFLRTQGERERTVFMARYFYVMPVNEIAARLGMNANSVKTLLRRTRQRLACRLKEEGLL